MLGGHLKLTSTKGGGTRVCMELPLRAPGAAERP